MTATPVSVLPNADLLREDKNRISRVGHHWGELRLISPGLHDRIESVSSRCRIVAQRTYVGRLIPHQSREVLDFLPSAILSNGNLFGSMTRGEQTLMEGEGEAWEGRMVGRLGDGRAFKLDYLFASYLINAGGEFSLTYGWDPRAER